MVIAMKSTARMLGGYKAGRTRRENQIRHRGFERLREIAMEEGYLLPGINPHPDGGFELSYAFDKEYWCTIRCSTIRECLDYIVEIFSFGCWYKPKILSCTRDKATSWHHEQCDSYAE